MLSNPITLTRLHINAVCSSYENLLQYAIFSANIANMKLGLSMARMMRTF